MTADLTRIFHPGKRRATPIPVAPPRIPTPMPVPSNNNNPVQRGVQHTVKDQQQHTSKAHSGTTVSSALGASTSLATDIPKLITKASYKLLDNDVKTAWINPRLISKIDMEIIKSTEYVPPPNANHHQHHMRSHQNQQQVGGRPTTKEWEMNGRAKYSTNTRQPSSTAAAAVPAPTLAAADVRRRRTAAPAPKTMEQKIKSHQTKKRASLISAAPSPILASFPASAAGLRTQKTVAGFAGNNGGGSVSGGAIGDYRDSAVFGVYSETKYNFRVNGMANSAQASAAAAFFARAAQKLNLSSSPHRRKSHNSSSSFEEPLDSSGFCGALQRTPPPVPPALLRRIGVKEVTGVGKVKVMLRVSKQGNSSSTEGSSNGFFSLDKRKKQVNLIDPSVCGGGGGGSTAPEDRRVGVAAPKMFAFDAIFSQDDSQSEVCSSALTDVIHAVINGTDGCLFCFGHAGLGKSYTMLGTPENANTLGIIPCAISWLFKGINEQKQKTGARFSVRVSAVEVCGPTNQMRDLLAGYANDSEQSPGVYLRDDPLFGPHQAPHCELRVPTAEKAAQYLDAAIECRTATTMTREDSRDSHLLFTLHVYQYSVAGKGGVAGGRSRLHLIDLGNSERGKASGGIPLSGVGNILLAIFNGQKHLPYKEHKLTQLLKDCLSSLTCHAAMIAHVSPSAKNYSDTLTTVQLASRIHRMRRRRIKFVAAAAGNNSGGSSGEEHTRTTGTSSEPDPSSSDLSADTVIYVGPADEATDCEHPPVYIPSLNSGDNRCSMTKALRGSIAERPKVEEKSRVKNACQSKDKSAQNTPKSSPIRTPSKSKNATNGASDEQWIDGPRISKSKVAEARHLMKEPCHVKKRETWIDGPMQAEAQGYGYMDSHKKNMIRKWVEHQTSQIQKTKHDQKPYKEMTQFKTEDKVHKPLLSTVKKQETVEESVIRTGLKLNAVKSDSIPECKTSEEETGNHEDEFEDEEPVEIPPALPLIQPLSSREVSLESLDILLKERKLSNAEYNLQTNNYENDNVDSDEDEILEIIEVEEPLEPVPTQDSCLQVTEEDIALCMGYVENPLPEVDQENPLDHPLRILSQENLTVVSTFTDSMSIYTDLERILPRHKYDPRYGFYNDDYEDPDNPPNGNLDENSQRKFDQLAKLHELYTNRLAKANVANSETYQKQQKSLSRCESLSLNDMLYGGVYDNGSIYSEPAYVQEKFCENCKINMSSGTNMDYFLSASTQDLRLEERKTEELGGRFQRYCHNYVTDHQNLAYLRHPDGASNPNLREGLVQSVAPPPPPPPPNSLPSVERINRAVLSIESGVTAIKLTQKGEEYDSGHDSTPRTSKHSPAAISRRAESGYDSVVRDSESSSIDSDTSRLSQHHRNHVRRGNKCNKHKHDNKSFCSWFLNPFTCKYIDEPPETHF